MTERAAPRHHYAIAVEKVRGGYKVLTAVEHRSRGEADKGSLRLLLRFKDVDAVTLDRELADGEVLPASALRR
jgi:hypothetical protein